MYFDNFIIGNKRRGEERGELAKKSSEFRVLSSSCISSEYRVERREVQFKT
jgi:hypothetical protein